MKLPYTSLTLLFASAICTQNIAQNTNRNEDGSMQKETDYVSLLCGKEWKWNEGIVGNHPYESVVFSLEYDTNKTFRYNQRAEKNYWRVNGNHITHSIAPFGKKKKNPFGIFDGEYEITKITDSILVLTKINGKPENPATVLRFIIIPKVNNTLAYQPSGNYKKDEAIVPVPEKMNENILSSTSQNDSEVGASKQIQNYPNKIIETITGADYTATRTIIKKPDCGVTILEKKQSSNSPEIKYSRNGKSISKEEYESLLPE